MCYFSILILIISTEAKYLSTQVLKNSSTKPKLNCI